MRRFFLLMLVFAGIFGAVVSALAVSQMGNWDFSLFKQEWKDNDGRVITNLSYGSGERNVFDLYLPANIDKKKANGLMLFVHGGSWTSGKKEDMSWACKRYAKAGYVTATMNYTLVGEKTKGYINAMNSEIELCVKRISHVADSLGIRIDKMAIGGYSAGGHLAMLYAYTHRHNSAIPLAFCISYVGPADMNRLFPVSDEAVAMANDELRSGSKGDVCKKLDGSIYSVAGHVNDSGEYSADVIDSLLTSISPITYISNDMVPTVFAYGGKDRLVKSYHADSLEVRCQRHGAVYEMIRFPNSGHGLERDPDCVEQLNKTILQFARTYFGY